MTTTFIGRNIWIGSKGRKIMWQHAKDANRPIEAADDVAPKRTDIGLMKDLMNSKFFDCAGRSLEVGDSVRVARFLGAPSKTHAEYRKSFRKVAGRLTTIIGWDYTGGAWIPFGLEVLTVECHRLRRETGPDVGDASA